MNNLPRDVCEAEQSGLEPRTYWLQVRCLNQYVTLYTCVLGRFINILDVGNVQRLATGKKAVMLYGWEGNRRSGVALPMHHRLSGISTYGLNGLEKGDEHRIYAVQWSTAPLPLLICMHDYQLLQRATAVCTFPVTAGKCRSDMHTRNSDKFKQ